MTDQNIPDVAAAEEFIRFQAKMEEVDKAKEEFIRFQAKMEEVDLNHVWITESRK